MGNLISKGIEKLECFPSRERFRDGKNEPKRNYGHEPFPYKRFHNFLRSRLGKHVDKVLSEYCHADWVPIQYRTYHNFSETVTFNTFMRDGKIWHYPRFMYQHGNEISCGEPITSSYSHIFYVNPKNKVLCEFKMTPEQSRQSRSRPVKDKRTFVPKWSDFNGAVRQYVKSYGIWYEIKVVSFPQDSIFYRKRHATSDNTRLFPPDHCKSFFDFYSRTGMKVIEKYQLDTNELKDQQLVNDVDIDKIPCKVCGGWSCQRRHNLV